MSDDDFVQLYVVSSSGPDGYMVTFDMTFPEEGLCVECDCPAGQRNQLCKHKLSLIKGDNSIFNPEYYSGEGFDESEWLLVETWVEKSGLQQIIKDYENRLAQLENSKKKIQAAIRKEKKHLARVLSEGVRS